MISSNRRIQITLGLIAVLMAGLASAAPTAPQGIDMPSKAPTLKAPVAVTTIGQAPSAMMVRLLLQKAKIQVVQKDLLTPQDIAEAAKNPNAAFKTLIMTMGTSLKGMGGAGVNVDSEVTRCNALVAEAKKHGIVVVGVQIEGAARRSDESDEKSIRAVAPQSDVLLIRREVDNDNYFTNMAKKNGVPIIRAKEAADFGYVFGTLFGSPAK